MFRSRGLGRGILFGAGVPGVGLWTCNTLSCCTAKIGTTGAWPSTTLILSPRSTARRYSLNRDLRSAILTFFMTIL